MEITVRPIDVWPDGWQVQRDRKPNPFKVRSYDQTLDLLTRELGHLQARSAHLQLDVDGGQVRRDGYLKANARVRHPGVILTVDTKHLGVLTYPCDTFERTWSDDPPSWQINLRAIALGLEALRKVERYGIAERGQQYAGFGALPPGGPTAVGAAMTVEAAVTLLCQAADRWPATDVDVVARLFRDEPSYLDKVYRLAVKAAHPDAGGAPAEFRRLTEARDLLLQEADRG